MLRPGSGQGMGRERWMVKGRGHTNESDMMVLRPAVILEVIEAVWLMGEGSVLIQGWGQLIGP